jgi:photosystem II stability/assembly factor-like uncharacterized protein
VKKLAILIALATVCLGQSVVFHGVVYIGDTVYVSRSDPDTLECSLFLSEDNGHNWECREVLFQGRNWPLWDVDCVNDSTCWAAGLLAAVFKTTDAGENWTHQSLGNLKWVGRVHAVDTSTVWCACGDRAYGKSIDGGVHWWWDFTHYYGLIDYYGIAAFDGNEAWAAGGWPIDSPPGGQGYIAHTTDGGTPPWDSLDASTVHDYLDIFMRDPELGWFVGGMSDPPYDPVVMMTTDGGDNWVDKTPDVGYTLRAVQFLSDTEGWVCGRFGTILHTTDGGDTWEDHSYPTEVTLFDIMFSDDQRGCAVGDSGLIVFTDDGGQTWSERTPDVAEPGRIVGRTSPFTLTFPGNPMKGEIRFSLEGQEPVSVRVFDRSGSCVAELTPRTGEHVLSARGLSSGTYFVEVTLEDHRGVYRFSLLE